MRLKVILSVLILLPFVNLHPNPSFKSVRGEDRFTIIYTNDVQGEIEPCG